MLILAVTYNAGFTQLISQEELPSCSTKLYNFLAPCRPSLAKDAEILQSVQRLLFLGNVNELFSSADN